MADSSPSLDPQLLDRNLDALRRGQPDLAASLLAARAQLPETIATATRDGRINFRIRQADGRETWFGRTSIPQVRAAALIDVFQAGQANVLLPGVGEGSEAELLLQRLGPHRAVFAWENDPVNLLLAMQLHDFSSAIENERLVLILADESKLARTLAETLRRMRGHLCPERILLWPWQTQAGISACKSAVEAAYREIERERQAQLADLRSKLDSLPARSAFARAPTAALFSIHTTEETWAWADVLTAAASASGWKMPAVVVRTPADVHPVARAARLAGGLDRVPDFALLLDVCRADIADVLPPDVPAISWLTREPASDAPPAERIGPADRLITTSSTLTERLIALGVDSARITVSPLPVLATCEDPPDWADRPIDAAVIANLTSTDPQSHGFELPSHVGIWNAMVDLIRSNLDDFADTSLLTLLERVESKVRVRIDDPGVRSRMLAALGGPAAASLIWQNLAQALATSGLTVTFRGFGWPEMAGLSVVRDLPNPAGRLQFYQQAKCVVFASPTGAVPPDLLLAAEAGAVVLWRSHGCDVAPGGLATLLTPGEETLCFPRNQALVPTLRKLLAGPETWRPIVTAARRRCRCEHAAATALARLRAAATSFLSDR